MTRHNGLTVVMVCGSRAAHFAENARLLSAFRGSLLDLICVQAAGDAPPCPLCDFPPLPLTRMETLDQPPAGMDTAVMAQALGQSKGATILFVDAQTLLNEEHFSRCMAEKQNAGWNFLAGAVLVKTGEHWRRSGMSSLPAPGPQEPDAHLLRFAASCNLFGGVIFSTAFLRRHFSCHDAGNLCADVELVHAMCASGGQFLPHVFALRDKSAPFRFVLAELDSLFISLESVFSSHIEEPVFRQFLFRLILPHLWARLKSKKTLNSRLDAFENIRRMVKEYWPDPDAPIGFAGRLLTTKRFLSLDPIALLHLAKLL